MVLCIKKSVISTSITSLYGFQPSSVVLCIQNCDLRTKIACDYGSHSSPVKNSVPSTSNTSLYGSQTSSVDLSTHNSVLSTSVSRLYGFHPTPVVLCMQNSDFRTRITYLCGSKTSPGLFHVKQQLLVQNNQSLWDPALICGF